METIYISQYKRSLICTLFCCLLLTACSWNVRQPENASVQEEEPEIFPDYRDVTVPVNISPLNFRLTRECEHQYVLITEVDALSVTANAVSGSIRMLGENCWKKMPVAL